MSYDWLRTKLRQTAALQLTLSACIILQAIELRHWRHQCASQRAAIAAALHSLQVERQATKIVEQNAWFVKRRDDAILEVLRQNGIHLLSRSDPGPPGSM